MNRLTSVPTNIAPIIAMESGFCSSEPMSNENSSGTIAKMVVSDVMMPEIDGIELCKRIKTDHNLSHLPIILLTAKAMNLYIEEGFQAGADDYIVKPFKVSTLKIRIKNILNRQEKMKKIYGKQLSLKSAGIEVESIDKAFVDKYIAIVKENISNPDFNIDQLCKEQAISRANLYRKVKAITT